MGFIAISLLVFMALFFGYAKWIERQNRHLQYFDENAAIFHENAKVLLAQKDVPVIILMMLSFISRKMQQRSSAREFIFSVIKTTDDDGASTEHYEQINRFISSNKDLEQTFRDACRAAMRALSYRSPFFGFIMRKVFLFDDRLSKDRPAQLVLQIERRVDKDIQKKNFIEHLHLDHAA